MTGAPLKILAFVGSICPMCVARRKWPGSLFGRVTARIERRCPFCLAYRKVRRQNVEE